MTSAYAPLPTSPSLVGAPFAAHATTRRIRLWIGILVLSSACIATSFLVIDTAQVIESVRDRTQQLQQIVGWQIPAEDDDPNESGVFQESPTSELDEFDKSSLYDPPSQEAEANTSNLLIPFSCSPALMESLSDPARWVVSRLDEMTYEIHPFEAMADDEAQLMTSDTRCFEQAAFSARLVSTEPEVIRALHTPTHVDGTATYRVEIPPHLSLPRATYQVEVTIEFGFLPGVVEGQVCGEAEFCDVDGVRFVHYVGKVLQHAERSDGYLTLGQMSNTALRRLPLCDTLDDLDGFWFGKTFVPVLDGQACSLQSIRFPAPFRTGEPIWINIVGDSNARNLVSILGSTFGSGTIKMAYVATTSSDHNGEVASLRLASSGGVLDRQSSIAPDIIITWTWWYESYANMKTRVKAARPLIDSPLETYLKLHGLGARLKQWPDLVKKAKTLRPHRTYLSLGSHSERVSASGEAKILQALFDPNEGLSPSTLAAANLRLFTTTFCNSSNIPQSKFPRQEALRNNLVIAARNEVVKAQPALQDRTIDVAALSRGVTREWTKTKGQAPHVQVDAVHFQDHVYREWSRVIWTDLGLAR